VKREEIQRDKLRIIKIRSNEIKIEDAANLAPFRIRVKYVNSQFFLECLRILGNKRYHHNKQAVISKRLP
jgi:hypothetical protein